MEVVEAVAEGEGDGEEECRGGEDGRRESMDRGGNGSQVGVERGIPGLEMC